MSILTEASRSVVFSLAGRLTTPSAIPTFERPSATTIENYINGGLSVTTIPSYEPAINPFDGSFLFEPERTNFVNHTLNLSHLSWIFGSSVQTRTDTAYAPNGSDKAETVFVGLGTGGSNVIRRTVRLKPGTNYILSQAVQLKGGQFTVDDLIRVTGAGVVAPVSATYFPLNGYVDKYRIVQLAFKTSGMIFSGFGSETSVSGKRFRVDEVTNSTVTIEGLDIVAGKLIGAKLLFEKVPGTLYTITNNQKVGATQTITVSPATLVTDGILQYDSLTFSDSSDVDVTVESYLPSAVTFNWGGIQIEEGNFRTSFIYQGEEIQPRSRTILEYKPEDNPLKGLKTFSVMIDLKDWVGDGNIVDLGDLKFSIVDSKLEVQAENVLLRDSNLLPNPALIMVQVSSENSSLSLYVNSKLINRVALPSFTPAESQVKFLSTGIRCFQSFSVMNRIFSDGQVASNQFISGDLATVLANRGQDFIEIDNTITGVILPSIEVPPAEEPVARALIGVVNKAGFAVIVDSAEYFTIDTGAIVERDEGSIWVEVGRVNITGISANTITLDTVSGIQVGDRLAPSYVRRPGKASIRLPFSSRETQVISATNSATKVITLTGSTTAFEIGNTVIIQTSKYQDLGQFLISAKNDVNKQLTLEGDITGIATGDLVILPRSETRINGKLYDVVFITEVSGVRVSQKGDNGFVVENSNPEPRFVDTMIRVPI